MTDHQVILRTRDGEFVAVIAGLGRNRGTWDATHSRRTARAYAAQLSREDPAHRYTAEQVGAPEETQ